MRRIREAESQKLNEALERRKMKINARQMEDDTSENSEEDSLSEHTNSEAGILTLPMSSMGLTNT